MGGLQVQQIWNRKLSWQVNGNKNKLRFHKRLLQSLLFGRSRLGMLLVPCIGCTMGLIGSLCVARRSPLYAGLPEQGMFPLQSRLCGSGALTTTPHHLQSLDRGTTVSQSLSWAQLSVRLWVSSAPGLSVSGNPMATTHRHLPGAQWLRHLAALTH